MRPLSRDTLSVDLSPFIDAFRVLETVTSARSKSLLSDGGDNLSNVFQRIAPRLPGFAAIIVRDVLATSGQTARRAGATIETCTSFLTQRGD